MENQKISLRDKLCRYKTAPVIFIHVDTTGLSSEDEIIRLTILSDDVLIYDQIFHSSRIINDMALRVSGIDRNDIENSIVKFEDEIEDLENMLKDKLLVCVNESFTQKFLNKAGLHLESSDLLDIAKGTDFFSRDKIKSAAEAMAFYECRVSPNMDTFNRNFVFYECACKLKTMANLLLKDK